MVSIGINARINFLFLVIAMRYYIINISCSTSHNHLIHYLITLSVGDKQKRAGDDNTFASYNKLRLHWGYARREGDRI